MTKLFRVEKRKW